MDSNLQQLIQDFISNGDEFDNDALLDLQKKINPYAYAINSESTDQLAFSFTNLRANYLRRFTTTCLIGFVFRMLREWEPPATVRRWKPKRKAAGKAGGSDVPHRADEFLAAADMLSKQAVQFAQAESDARAALAESARLRSEAVAAELVADESKNQSDANAAALARKKAAGAADIATKAAGRMHRMRLETALMFEAAGRDSGERVFADVAAAEDNPDSEYLARTVRMERPAPNEHEIPATMAVEIARTFLASIFEFDPDAHVRSAYDEFVLARRVPTEQAAEHINAIAAEHAAQHNYTVQPPITVDPEDPCRPSLEELQKVVPRDDPARAAVDIIPPQDTFHRLDFYASVNHEKLREATRAIYHDNPDLDAALIPYEVLKTDAKSTAEEKFDAFKVAHGKEVIADICLAEFGKWTLLCDFDENRARIDVLGPETSILKRIFDRHEEDAKMGKALMEHRIRRTKADNIAKNGPDDPGLAQYIKHGAGSKSAAASGARRTLSPEELAVLEKAKGDLAEARRLTEDKEYEAIEYARAYRDAVQRISNDLPPTEADMLIVGGETMCVVDSEASQDRYLYLANNSDAFRQTYEVVKARCSDVNIRTAADMVVALADKRARERQLNADDKRAFSDALSRLATAREQATVPSNAVQSYVYTTATNADGERVLTKHTRYIEAEAPTELGEALDEMQSQSDGKPKKRPAA